jgi:TRAP transporter TAXI family solute receptor
MKKSMIVLVLVIFTAGFVFAGGGAEKAAPGAPAKPETVYLNMGSTSSASGVYAWCVAAANAVNKSAPGVQVTVVESGAAIDNLRKIKAGIFEFALAVDVPSAYQMYKGIDTFAGQGMSEIRWLLVRNILANRMYVRKDSGVKSWAELAGKRFCPGIPGSSAATYVTRINDILKTGINLVPMALGDAINALKENRIVGMQKSGGLYNIDAALIEVNMTTPLTALGFTKEEVAQIQKAVPYLGFVETKKGAVKELPDAGGFWEESDVVGGVSTSKMSQEIGYKIVKAYYENLADINAAYGPSKGWDPIADYFKYIANWEEVVPAHAGLVQYAKERGIEVPAHFIPPEYKAK